jgi:hypothetical protein
MKLVVFGDSHPAGSEIDQQYSLQCYEKSFAQKIARQLSLSCENYSIAGASNSYIATECYKYLDKTYSDLFVLISWGAANRATVYDHDTEDFLHINEYDANADYLSHKQKTMISSYYQYHYPSAEEEWKILGTIIGLYNYLKNKNIKFLMMDSTQAFAHWHQQYFQSYDYFELSNPTTYWHQYEQWKQSSIYNNDRWNKHAPEQWHEIWAEKVLQHIREQQLV